MRASTPTSVRPLLKWAGGKRQLLPVLAEHYPPTFRRYIEPFVGSGAVFFDLLNTGRLARCEIQLCDVNPDLIGCYWMVRDQSEHGIRELRTLAREDRRCGSECYYDVRDRRFNPARAELKALSSSEAGVAARYTPTLAAMLIFLNRTGFNGLFRLNRSGGFNVPAGRYASPRICDGDHLIAVSQVFQRRGIALEHRSFSDALDEAAAGDFVYCDPPYEPLSRTASFASY